MAKTYRHDTNKDKVKTKYKRKEKNKVNLVSDTPEDDEQYSFNHYNKYLGE